MLVPQAIPQEGTAMVDEEGGLHAEGVEVGHAVPLLGVDLTQHAGDSGQQYQPPGYVQLDTHDLPHNFQQKKSSFKPLTTVEEANFGHISRKN